MTRLTITRTLLSVFLGITGLLPASYFLFTLLARVCFGSKALYRYIAPSFLQSPFDLFALHKAQVIIGCLLISLSINGLAIFRLGLEQGRWGWDVRITYRRNWLNTAVALQAALLLIVLTVYTLIQHIRY